MLYTLYRFVSEARTQCHHARTHAYILLAPLNSEKNRPTLLEFERTKYTRTLNNEHKPVAFQWQFILTLWSLC